MARLRRLILLALLFCTASISSAAVKGTTVITTAAAVTTVIVNSGTILKWIRHPKRESKKAAHAVKNAVKGKN